MKIPSRWVCRIVGAACALAYSIAPAMAEDGMPERASAAAPQLTRADVEAWLDGYIPYAIQRADIAGAVVVVVRDGQILLQKGYGVADAAKGTPVDAERTLFRIASISKTFTWTAVMQQVEQGRLDLDRDVNAYLDFEIPPAFGKPITLRHLMTQSPGFEETVKSGMYDPDSTSAVSIGDYLKAHVPARIFPPGEVPAYSNYGTTLAGYIVERVSGEPYLDYMERHIFEPLGMRASTFRQPLPEPLRARLSQGYIVGSGPAQAFEGIVASPAGALASTGADMARFMIAHLQGGRYGEQQILSPDTARLMHAPAFHAIASINGMTLGFFQHDRNGHRIIGHAGDTALFHSDLRLYLDDGVGIFMSLNSTGAGFAAMGIRTALFEQFTDRYFPADTPHEPVASTAAEHARLLAGTYEMSRGFVNTFLSARGLFEQIKIEANEDGTIRGSSFLFAGLSGQPKIWREVAPFVWREQGGRERWGASVRDGRVVAVGADTYAGALVLRPVPAWKSSVWNVPFLFASMAVLALTLLAWPVSAFVRNRYVLRNGPARRSTADQPGAAQKGLALRLVRITAIVNLAFLLGWAFVLVYGLSHRTAFDGSLDPWLRLLQLLGVVGALGAAAAVWRAWILWADRVSVSTKIWSIAVAIACLAITWFAFAFKLITVGLDY